MYLDEKKKNVHLAFIYSSWKPCNNGNPTSHIIRRIPVPICLREAVVPLRSGHNCLTVSSKRIFAGSSISLPFYGKESGYHIAQQSQKERGHGFELIYRCSTFLCSSSAHCTWCSLVFRKEIKALSKYI